MWTTTGLNACAKNAGCRRHDFASAWTGALGALAIGAFGAQVYASAIPFGGRIDLNIAANGAQSVYAADMDGDGDIDALSASNLDGRIIWYENTGGSSPVFIERVISATAGGAMSVFAIDIDGDGDMDALSASTVTDKVAWYENNGALPPVFTERIVTVDPDGQGGVEGFADGAFAVYAADIDGDGDVDICSASALNGRVAWYESDGGSPPIFTPRVVSDAVSFASSVSAADVDGDGDLDMLATAFFGGAIFWFDNNGATPPVFTMRSVVSGVTNPSAVTTGDVDGDGDLDVVAAIEGDGAVTWYENDGAALPMFLPRVIDAAAPGASWVQMIDLDSDGDLDALSASSNTIAWHENDGAPSPTFTLRTIQLGVFGARSVFAADVNGDGDLDALSASEFDDRISWYDNKTIHRNADLASPVTVSMNAGEARSVAAADVDRDGDMDLLSASSMDNTIAWYESNGASPPVFVRRIITNTAMGAISVFPADIDGDGDPDAVSASLFDNTLAWHENDGAAPPIFTPRVISSTLAGARWASAADMDGDGDTDVLSASDQDNTLAWFENNGATPPLWTMRTLSTTAMGARAIVPADMDGDGDMDALAASFFDDRVSWFESDGLTPPGFTEHTLSLDPDGVGALQGFADAPTGVFAADLDGDGDLDALSASQMDNRIAWYENLGGTPPTFTPRTISTMVNFASSVTASDLDGDGDVDVVATSSLDGAVVWFENDGLKPPGFVMRQAISVASFTESATTADIDGDGDNDIITASVSNNLIAQCPNKGGQYTLETANVSLVHVQDQQQFAVLSVTATNNGRAGDSDMELASLDLQFAGPTGAPLTTAQATGLVDFLLVYQDSGSGVFEPNQDTPVATVSVLSLSAGVQRVLFTSGDPGVRIAPGSSKLYFVVVRLSLTASAQTPNTFQIIHLASASQVVDATSAGALSQDVMPDVASSIIIIGPFSCIGDINGDGVVGAGDLAILIGVWGSTIPQVDFDNSGQVGAGDLALLLGFWNCPN